MKRSLPRTSWVTLEESLNFPDLQSPRVLISDRTCLLVVVRIKESKQVKPLGRVVLQEASTIILFLDFGGRRGTQSRGVAYQKFNPTSILKAVRKGGNAPTLLSLRLLLEKCVPPLCTHFLSHRGLVLRSPDSVCYRLIFFVWFYSYLLAHLSLSPGVHRLSSWIMIYSHP